MSNNGSSVSNEQLLEAMWQQNKQLAGLIEGLYGKIQELTDKNAKLQEQLDFNTLIAKSTCPVYSEEERKEALMGVMREKENQERRKAQEEELKNIFL